MRLSLIGTVVVIGQSLAFAAGWCVSGYIHVRSETERHFRRDCELAAPILAADPAFRRVESFDFPVNGFCLGWAAAQTAHDRLRIEVNRVFGAARAEQSMADVFIESATEPNVAP